MNPTVAEIIDSLRRTLPVTFRRRDAPKLTGFILKYQTLANLDSKKQGPPSARCNGRVVYSRDSFCDWLASRMR